MYTVTPELTLGAGASYDQRTGTVTPIPLGVIYWEPAPRFSIRGVLPASAFVSWRPVNPLTLELTGSLEGAQFHLSDDAFGYRKASLAYSIARAGPGARIHFTKFLHAELVGGLAFARRFELFIDERSQGSGFLGVGPYFGATLWIGASGWAEKEPTPPGAAKTSL